MTEQRQRSDTGDPSLAREREPADDMWRALDMVLSWPERASAAARPERVRSRLRNLVARAADGCPIAPPEAAARLEAVASGLPPDATSPAALADDAAFLRCSLEHAAAAVDLMRMRTYLEYAKPGAQRRALLVDRAVTQEQVSFVVLLTEPHRLDSMRATFETFRAAYAGAYVDHHRKYWRAAARLRRALEEAAPEAEALAGLNTLRSLGKPVGTAALKAYKRLVGGRPLCDARELSTALHEWPLCPECGVSMEDGPPAEDVEETLRALHAALRRQQARLASEAVRRILARGGERIERFVDAVQAADVAALARVVDNDLLTFLRELLAEPVAQAPEATDIFAELAWAHPVVEQNQVDEVAETLRRLLLERLAASRSADPSRPPTVRLLRSTPKAP